MYAYTMLLVSLVLLRSSWRIIIIIFIIIIPIPTIVTTVKSSNCIKLLKTKLNSKYKYFFSCIKKENGNSVFQQTVHMFLLICYTQACADFFQTLYNWLIKGVWNFIIDIAFMRKRKEKFNHSARRLRYNKFGKTNEYLL